jgi:hypothetical protein
MVSGGGNRADSPPEVSNSHNLMNSSFANKICDAHCRILKSIPSLTLVSGLAGLLFALLLGLLQWRIIWLHDHPFHNGDFETAIDWSPYPEFLALALNWWVPISILIMGTGIYHAGLRRRSLALNAGRCLHVLSMIGLVILGWWVFTIALPTGSREVWWMWWTG